MSVSRSLVPTRGFSVGSEKSFVPQMGPAPHTSECRAHSSVVSCPLENDSLENFVSISLYKVSGTLLDIFYFLKIFNICFKNKSNSKALL